MLVGASFQATITKFLSATLRLFGPKLQFFRNESLAVQRGDVVVAIRSSVRPWPPLVLGPRARQLCFSISVCRFVGWVDASSPAPAPAAGVELSFLGAVGCVGTACGSSECCGAGAQPKACRNRI